MNESDTTKVLLVVGKDIGFSKELRKYAIELAEQIGYSILAANLTPYKRIRSFFSDKSIDIADSQRVNAERVKELSAFMEEVHKHNIKFDAIASNDDLDQFLFNIDREHHDVDLVLLEPEYTNQSEKNPRSIPALSIANN